MGADVGPREEDPFDDTAPLDRIWKPSDEVDLEPILRLQARQAKVPQLPSVKPSEFTRFSFYMPADDGIGETGTGYDKFSFEGRKHMLRIYDTPQKRILLKCARQVEKCGRVTSRILLPDGTCKQAGDVVVGDEVATLDVPDGGSKMTTGRVSWVSRRYTKPCVRIQTRQGHVCEVATTHPMRVWDGWLEGGEVTKGARLAVVRRSGVFFDEPMPAERVKLTAYMIGDGHVGSYLSFTALPGTALLDFMESCDAAGVSYKIQVRKSSKAVAVRLRVGPLHRWMEDDGLQGTRSSTKFVPPWVFRLSEEQTALFLNRLWSTDGHVKKNGKSKYSVEYCSTSPQLIRDVQSLLWKFGIPSRIRENWPSYHKKQGVKKFAYILRVETQEGVRRFIQEIGALGKCGDVEVPTSGSNNNRDTYPVEINNLIKQIINSRGAERRQGRYAENSLRSAGLRETLEYPPTKDKLQLYVYFFRSDERYDQALVSELEKHLDTDVFWDSVVSVEHIGEQECVDFEVENTHNFVADGFITHNSTYLGNRALCYMSIVPAMRVLYVSPSATQTKTFSNDRIKDPIDTSPLLRKFTTRMLSSNILEKQFVNRSKITMRYAFLNADRSRGIPADALFLDEFQDILGDNIPVIEQCLAHARELWKQNVYAGTPKSLDNNIEYYWSNFSTQNEWVVPHDCKRGEAGRFWNVLGEKNIGKKGLICARCKTLINPMHEDAQWARMTNDGEFEGFRIPQLMVPWKPWREILLDYKRYPRDKFYNEVLGFSYDSGLRPLTQAQLKSVCKDHISMTGKAIEKYRNIGYSQPIFAGIDWGTGENAYTVISLGTYVESKFRIFYIHRFEGEDVDPPRQLARIAELMDYFNVRLAGCDYGGGYDRNDALTRRFGPQRIQKFQYLAQGSNKVVWDGKLGRWKIARTELMSDVFNAIKRGRDLEFAKWEEFKDPYGSDMLNIFSEYNETLRKVQYKHTKNKPDDSFHSVLYCWLASMFIIPRPDIMTPIREEDGQPMLPQMTNLYQG